MLAEYPECIESVCVCVSAGYLRLGYSDSIRRTNVMMLDRTRTHPVHTHVHPLTLPKHRRHMPHTSLANGCPLGSDSPPDQTHSCSRTEPPPFHPLHPHSTLTKYTQPDAVCLLRIRLRHGWCNKLPDHSILRREFTHVARSPNETLSPRNRRRDANPSARAHDIARRLSLFSEWSAPRAASVATCSI